LSERDSGLVRAGMGEDGEHTPVVVLALRHVELITALR
jgi:hypothetical protein